MKKYILIIFWANIILFNIHAFAQAQENSSDTQASNMLRTFYTCYIKAYNCSNDLNLVEKEFDFLKKKYCTKDLLDKIAKQLKNDELDYDPFIKAQDSNIGNEKTLNIKKDGEKNNIYIVTYVDVYDHKIKVINVHLVKQKDGYKIDSVW